MSGKDLLLKIGNKEHPVPASSVLYIKANRKLCYVVTATNKYIVTESLQSFEDRLSDREFFRIHRSYIISIKYIVSISSRHVHIIGAAPVPIGPRKKVEFMSRYERFG